MSQPFYGLSVKKRGRSIKLGRTLYEVQDRLWGVFCYFVFIHVGNSFTAIEPVNEKEIFKR